MLAFCCPCLCVDAQEGEDLLEAGLCKLTGGKGADLVQVEKHVRWTVESSALKALTVSPLPGTSTPNLLGSELGCQAMPEASLG